MGKVGKVKVVLDKPFYLAGDTVHGTVYLALKEEVDLDKVYVKVKGKEKVKWTEEWKEPQFEENGEGVRALVGHEEKSEDHEDKESFFKKKVLLVPEEGSLAAGKYKFPFSFTLPKTGKKGGKLPGSFLLSSDRGPSAAPRRWSGARGETKDLKAKVEYSLKAVVDLDDSKDLEAKHDFVVYPEPPEAVPTPSDERTASVMFCCCIDRGNVHMKATLDKNVYAPGEKARAVLEVANESALEVTAMAELNRLMHLNSDGHRITTRQERNLGRFDVIEPGESKTVEMEFDIPRDTLPSTAGRSVRCEYVLDIVSELQCAPDVELHFPVHIFVAPVMPTEWLADLPDADEYVVGGSCKVEDMPLKPGYGPDDVKLQMGEGSPEA